MFASGANKVANILGVILVQTFNMICVIVDEHGILCKMSVFLFVDEDEDDFIFDKTI